MLKSVYFFVAGLFLVSGCTGSSPEKTDTVVLREVSSPANPGSGEPNFYTDKTGRVFLSWIEAEGDGHVLRYSLYGENENWRTAKTITSGTNWFVNWADFPSLVVSEDLMASHWLVKSGAGTYAYDVHIALSEDNGTTWSESIVPHRDNTETEHGFVSMLPWQDGVLAVWLDGRQFAAWEGVAATHEMTLRAAVIDRKGELSQESQLDARVCDCCPTSAVLSGNSALVVYRDRSPDEIRDISIVKYEGGKWTAPATVHADNWKIEGCPVNGPAIDAFSGTVAVAWFTMAQDTPHVKVVFSHDGGAAFGTPISLDSGNPIGRVDVLMLEQESALVSWMETVSGGQAEIRVRRVNADGSSGPARTITRSGSSRASGFPRIARHNENVILAWTEEGNPGQVRTAVASIEEL